MTWLMRRIKFDPVRITKFELKQNNIELFMEVAKELVLLWFKNKARSILVIV